MEDPEDGNSDDTDEGTSLPSFTGVIIAAATLPIAIVFKHFGRADAGMNLAICLGMSSLAAVMRWRLRRHVWFWIALVVVFAGEAYFTIGIQWPHWHVSREVLLPIALAGLFLSLGAISLAEKLFGKPEFDDENLQDSES